MNTAYPTPTATYPLARPRHRIPAFCVEFGETSHGSLLVMDLLSRRWQAVLQKGTPASTAFLWQQILTSLLQVHGHGEVQVWMFSPRPEAFAWLLQQWDDRWFITAHANQFSEELMHLYSILPPEPDLPVHVVLIDDLETFLSAARQQERSLQVLFLEGARRGLRLFGSLNRREAAVQGRPLMQCFTNYVNYLGDGWFRLYRRADALDFRLTLSNVQIPRVSA